MYFSLVFHNHQPIGQLPWAFEDAWRESYQPFLDVLERHPNIRVGLHYSGPLLEWLLEHRSATLEQVRRMVERGQVEILGGGLYEPILAVWPVEDRLAQIRRLRDRVTAIFGVAPQGLWLAERVWEPQLADDIAAAAMEYTLVDSTVFETAGVGEADSFGYFHTGQGISTEQATVAVFPINQTLRQLIPWKEPGQTLEYLHRVTAQNDPDALVVFADDGEKFGAWPGTFDWIFRRGWLEKFFALLSRNEDWLQTVTPAQYRQRFASRGAIALPAGSYREMQEWSRGNWRYFLTRYSESRDMYDEVLRVGALVKKTTAEHPDREKHGQAYDHVLRAQSNDAYWHGVFGGLYLSHLRQAVYSEAAQAQVLIEEKKPFVALEREPSGDLILHNERQKIGFRTAGGHIFLWVSKAARHNLMATLQRRRESYHDNTVPVDWYPRGALLDHFFHETTTPASFAAANYREQGDFVTEPWSLDAQASSDTEIITATREGGVWTGEMFAPLLIQKSLALQADSDDVRVHYTFLSGAQEPLELWWGVEWNIALSGSELPERHYHALDHKHQLRLDEPAEFTAVTNPIVADRWLQLWVEWELPEAMALWHVPLWTISQKEGGHIERTYQQSAFILHRRLQLAPQEPHSFSSTARVTAGRPL